MTLTAIEQLEKDLDIAKTENENLKASITAADYRAKLRSWAVDRVVRLHERAQVAANVDDVIFESDKLVAYIDVKPEGVDAN